MSEKPTLLEARAQAIIDAHNRVERATRKAFPHGQCSFDPEWREATEALRDARVMAIEPVIVKRTCPGFLAISPHFAPICFAVEGRTEDEARANFYASRELWAELTAMP